MADQAPQAPGEGGGGIMGQPTWVYLAAGGVAIGLFLLWRKRGASSPSSTLPDQSVAPIVDPTTGGLIDPSTGQPYIGSTGGGTSDNSGWLTAAQQAASSTGYAPGLVDQALYDFLNGNPLNAQESGVINTLLGKVGYPPIQVPFLSPTGWSPNPKPPVATPPHVKRPKNWPTNWPWPWTPGKPPTLPIPKVPVNKPAAPPRPVTAPRPHLPGVVQRPTPIPTRPIHGSPQLLPTPKAASFISQVLAGRAPLPQGIKIPAGYHFRPGSRILVRNR